MPIPPKRVLSLFSGCGGMDLGFEGNFKVLKNCLNPASANASKNFVDLPPTGFETVFANDIKPSAKIAWQNHFKRRNAADVFHARSVVDLIKAAKTGAFSFPLNVDVVTGGFPCQDFSVAGKRNGFNSRKSHDNAHIRADSPSVENRGMLYYYMREVIGIVKPKVFIAENVKGLLTLGNAKDIIQKDFASIGKNSYVVVEPVLLNAADYGVPQKRERIFFMGFLREALKDGVEEALRSRHAALFPFPEITHGAKNENGDSRLLPMVTLAETFQGLAEPEAETKDLSQTKYSKAKWMGKGRQGQTEVNLDRVAPTIRSEHHGNIEFRRLAAERGGVNHEELRQGLKERRLTIRECARIQTFPDDYEFVFDKTDATLNSSEAYKLIGNAVPPLLAYHMARRLAEIWDKLFKRDDP